MGLYRIEHRPCYRYGIWQMEESAETLSSMLLDAMKSAKISSDEPITCPHSAPKRRQEFFAVRCLLAYMGINPVDVRYKPSGEPYLLNAGNNVGVSISHTKQYAAVMLSDVSPRIGIDIEMPTERIFRIADKFLLPEERQSIEKHTHTKETLQKALYLHWCGKEALYKAIHKEEINLLRLPLSGLGELQKSGELYALVENTRYEIAYTLDDSFILTCCCAK